jgi:PAS domain S-box-containing protein
MLMRESPPPAGDDSGDVVDILLVDDRVEDLAALSTVLSRSGYGVVTARSGQEALRALLKRDFALILLDVVMPNMDGFELASLIRKRTRTAQTPIIFLTAAGADYRQIYRGYSVGAVDYLSKPVDLDVVGAKVAIFADLFRKGRRIQRQAEELRAAERRQRELELKALRHVAQRRYRNLADAVPTLVWTATADGEVDYVNRRWAEFTGLDLEHTRGAKWLAALHPEDAPRVQRAWRESVDLGALHEIECRLRRSYDGAYRWHLCRAVPERAEDGAIVGWLGTYTDFEELKRALNARDEFLSIASHELRTPLTALKLRLQSLQRAGDLAASLRNKVDSAARQTDRLERLVDNLLDVSRITTGHLELELEPFDMSELFRDVAERFRDEISLVGSTLDLCLPEELPGTWDRMRVEQVLTNVLSNAVKYGSGKSIRVTLRASDHGAQFDVEDEGIGIAESDLGKIFGQFQRAAHGSKGGGLGMGLYIAQQIVTAHGGDIRVQSRIGSGTRFTVTLPSAPDPTQGSDSDRTTLSNESNPNGFLR